MASLTEILQRLSGRHRAALVWFAEHAGTTQSWPNPLPDGTLLASKAKGIYKPSWLQYALSVRQSLGGPYHDREPVVHADGTWTFLYFQENEDPANRDSEYTNRGLLECHKDRVPVGVFRQVVGRPSSKYQILGVAMVTGWEEGYFFLEGFSPLGEAQTRGPRPQFDAHASSKTVSEEIGKVFNPAGLEDARERITASIVVRRGQGDFRRRLLEA
jgi:hypothetical protein